MTQTARSSASAHTGNRAPWDHRRDPAPIRALQRWTGSGAADCALALSLAREGPNDWRPQALAWYFGGADLDDATLFVLAHRVLVLAARIGVGADPEVLAIAIADGLHRVRRRRCLAAAQRAKELHMRCADFRRLRAEVEDTLWRAIRSGLVRYLAACGYRQPLRGNGSVINHLTLRINRAAALGPIYTRESANCPHDLESRDRAA